MAWKKRPKYGNIKTTTLHGSFDSKKEARDDGILRIREAANEVRNIRTQESFYFKHPVTMEYLTYENGRRLCYKADHVYEENIDGVWVTVVQDSKGFKTKEYKIKKALMLWLQGINIREV